MEIIDVTLNPNDMGSGNTVNNGSLTVTGATTTGIRATHGKISGKWYWEVKLDTGDTRLAVGISNKTLPLSSFNTSYINTNWRGFLFSTGNKLPENTSYGVPSITGNIIGIALDLDIGTLELYRNGVSMGVSHTNIKELGEVYPTVGRISSFSTTTTFNFGLTPFMYEIPKKFYSYDGRQYGGSSKILLSSGDKYYSITSPIYATETAIPQMTSNTTPSGIAFASSIYGTGYEPWKAFDRSVGDYYGQNSIKTGHLGYEFSKRVVIGRYTLTANTNSFAPKDWTFEGSNDGEVWTVLDTQINQSWAANNTDKEYTIDINKTNSYKMYRLNWTANNGGGYVIIREFKMYERMPFNLLKLSNQSEQTFMNYGMERTINLTQCNGVKSIESNSIVEESGKTYEHTIDMTKRRVDKITLG